ncbi:MAG: hypothetical protein HOQ09_11705 [Gemmatimonadaceae bacterium]|nr:hypothetical protein [Gemmatimonadaceae bacterium]
MNARTQGARFALVAALMLAASCRGGDRADATADTAVAPVRTDSSARRVDSTTAAPRSDTAARHDSAVSHAKATPVLLVAVDSAIGDSLYHNSRGSCLTCHGPRGTGNASLGPSLRDSTWLDTDGSVAGIAGIVHDGVAEPKGGSARMPAFASVLDSASIHRIAIYVYSLSHPGAIKRDSAAAHAALPAGATDSTH